MKYIVTYYNEFYDQYFKNIATDSSNIKTFPKRTMIDTIEGETKEQCFEFIKDFLDSPEKPLTLNEAKADFGSDISNENAQKIIKFYNSRFEIYHKILNDIELHLTKNQEETFELKYILPEEANSFSLEDNEHYQVNAYILVAKL